MGADRLAELDMDATTYMKGIVQGTLKYDSLAIAVTCAAFNIHAIIMLAGTYVTTRANNDFKDCLVKLAYCRDGVFKEMHASVVNPDPDPKPIDTVEERGLEEDIHGTGILSEPSDEEEEDKTDGSGSDDSDLSDSHKNDFSGDEGDEGDPDIQPSASDSALDLRSAKVADDAMDVQQGKMTEHDDGMDSANSDCILVGVTRPAFTTKKRVFRSRSYVCHICPKNFEMQVSFVEHMKTEHPGSKLKCTLCIKLFVSPNGLFKHERSHEYLKYFCDYCSYMCQFPYQIKAHENTHTKTEWFGCNTCDKKFSSKAASRAHRKTHNLLIQCDLCPETNEKRYTSIQACNLHKCGMHGPGWTAKCGKHFKWKSKFSKHITKEDCKVCLKHRADIKLQYFLFLKKFTP